MENVRVYEIPNCKMVSSKCGMFGDKALNDFDKWISAQTKTMFPKDFLWFDATQGGFVWYYIYQDGLPVPDQFDLVDFPGGLYAVATGVDGENSADVITCIKQFLQDKGCFIEDTQRTQLGNIITPNAAQKAMGYSQMEYYLPIKVK